MEEMMEDVFDVNESDELEDAAQEEIDKVLHEITAGKRLRSETSEKALS